MPELPEVETIARGLEALVATRTIRGVDVVTPSTINLPASVFWEAVSGRVINRVWRRAKLLILDLDNGLHLVFHLKMTGRVWAGAPDEVPCKHTHLIFDLGEDVSLYFTDVRRFGYCRLLNEDDLEHWKFFAELGPEPLECGSEDFLANILGRKARIKGLLLDQRVVAGVGNIYADEALHLAGIHPARRADTIPQWELENLHRAVVRVLTRAIHLGGSTFRDFLNASGRPGNYQDEFLVYGRGGDRCPSCRTPLAVTKVAGRTSTYCPSCQPRDESGRGEGCKRSC